MSQDILKNTELFEKWARSEGYPYFRPEEYQRVLESSQLLEDGGCRVLDVGCGVGMVSSHIKSLGHQVTGLDISTTALNIALQEKRIDFAISQDLLSAELPEGKFDVVIVWCVLMLMFDMEKAFEKVASALRPGGEVLFFDHHARNPYTKMHFSRPSWVDKVLEGHRNVPRHAFKEEEILKASQGRFEWNAPRFHSMFTHHPHPVIDFAHTAARAFFGTVRTVSHAPWTANFISMVGKKSS